MKKKIYNNSFGISQEQIEILDKAENEKHNGNYEEAINLLNKVLYEDPGCVPALEELSDCQLSIGDDKKALKTAEFILTLSEKSYTANYLIGFILGKFSKFKQSIKYLLEANKLRPNNPEVLRCYGWSLFMSGEKTKGISLIERAKNLMPNDTQILNDLAVCMIETGSITKGIDLISDIQEIDPGNKRAAHTLSFLQKNIINTKKEIN